MIYQVTSTLRKLRVLLVNDFPVMLQGLRTTLIETGDIDVVAEASTAGSAMAAVRGMQLDLVLSDMALPDMPGLVLLKMIKDARPLLAVLMLGMYAEEIFAMRSLKFGSAGFITKDVDAHTLVHAVRRTANGNNFTSQSVTDRLSNQLSPHAEGSAHERLSKREFEVFCLIAAGKSLTEIGLGLHVSVQAISGYRTRIIEKTGLRTNADFTRYVRDQGLLVNTEEGGMAH